MKLDVNALRYLSTEEFRTLQAVELGQKNHEIVPIPLIDAIAGLKHGGTVNCLKSLLRSKLVHHDNSKYDGYRLTNLGYDFLAIKALVKRGCIASVGRQIGVGKESDVFEVLSEEGEVLALKLHRLGRTSFRAVKSKRDYLKHRSSFSWLYLSRLAALKEHSFMSALWEEGFQVPRPMGQSRHAVLMTMVNAVPLSQVRELQDPGKAYRTIMEMLEHLAKKGLVHCDLNEFNLLIDEEENVTLIDFPQMVSISHANARDLFERDVECVVRFFKKKLGYIPEQDPESANARPTFEGAVAQAPEAAKLLDGVLAASGFKSKHQLTLEAYAREDASESDSEGESQVDDDDEEEEEGKEDDSTLSSSSEPGELADEGNTNLRSRGVSQRGSPAANVLPSHERAEASHSGCSSSDSKDEVHLHGEGSGLEQRQEAGPQAAQSGQHWGPTVGGVLLGDSDSEGEIGAANGEGGDVGEGREREGERARGGTEARTAVQQRVVAEARRMAQQQIAAQSARGAHKATSKNRRQESRRQTSKSSGW